MRKILHKLQIKITACILLFVIIPIMMINLLLQLHLENQIQKNTDFAFENAVVNVDNTLKTLLREMGSTLNLLSTDDNLYVALQSPKKDFRDETKVRIEINNITSQYQKYVFYCSVDFLILDKNNIPYSTYYIKDSSFCDTDSTSEYLQDIMEKNLNYTYFSTSIRNLGKNSDDNVLCIGRTIRNHKKQYLGKAIIIIDEDKLFHILENSTLYTDSINILSDANGKIISTEDKSLIGKSSENYLASKQDHYVLSYPLYNKWAFISLISKRDLYRDSSYSFIFIIVDLFILIGFICTISLILHSFLKPIQILKKLMSNVENGDFSARFSPKSSDELSDLGISFNHMTEKLAVLFEQNQTQEKKLLQQENEKEHFRYKILQSQINPHFMFNTLNNIKWMAIINNDKAVANTISAFGRLLEKTLKSGGDNFTIREELEYVSEYLQVMQLHISQKISLYIYIDNPVIYDYYILKMLFQPIIENSIQHGFNAHTSEPQISIIITQEKQHIKCIIKDNGIGIPSEQLFDIFRYKTPTQQLSHSIGLSNTKERLKLFYGSSAQIEITSEIGKGTSVIFILPILLK